MLDKKILFLFYRTPLNYKFSNDKRQYLIYKTLSEEYETRILAFGDEDKQSDEQRIVRLEKSNLKKIFLFFFKLQSPRITHYQSKEFKSAFEENLNIFKPDFIYVEHLSMMQYVFSIKTPARIVFFNDESNFFVSKRNLRGNYYQKLRHTGLAKIDLEASKRSDLVITITEEEESFLRKKEIKNVTTIPYGIDSDYFSSKWEKPAINSILFIGDFSHYPNREAVKLLARKILPALYKYKIILKIVGRNIYRIKNFLPKNVIVYENVDDVRPYIYNSSVFVAPIFSGAGLRVKILEAALCGIPVITTTVANLGINLVNEEEAFICNSVYEFSERLREYFDSKFGERLDQMRRKARNKIVSGFDEKKVRQVILDTFNQITE